MGGVTFAIGGSINGTLVGFALLFGFEAREGTRLRFQEMDFPNWGNVAFYFGGLQQPVGMRLLESKLGLGALSP